MFVKGLSRRGSALLIVLGFLSFMMVSAVSFAIYMRIERQASSNFRHAITARHMLNAALYRAIDEIDGELRIEKISSEKNKRSLKYPEWPGHAKPSAVVNTFDNAQESRVLSMEALSFLPAILVNDVRRYAVTNQYDLNNATYYGTKWRTLSMPVNSIESGDNAYEEAVVGRYSYMCVNVSDMLDVNVCKAGGRDAKVNRVSIGHLFGPNSQTKQDAFDTYVEGTATRFETLQDFYACMWANITKPFGTVFGSPYHDYMTAGNDPNADVAFDEAANHVLITDAIAKAQPANATACNIVMQPPISQADLSAAQRPGVSFQNTKLAGRDGFQDALAKALSGRLPAGAKITDNFPLLLADYIDTDNIPKALNMPSVEFVPMVSQILIPPFFRPRIMEKIDPVQPSPPPKTPIKIFYLNAVPAGGPAMMQVQIELAWPYKHMNARTCPASSTYDVEVLAYVKIHTAAKDSNGFNGQPPIAMNGYLPLTGTAKVPDFSTKNDDNQDECFKMVMVPLTGVGGVTTLDFVKSDGTVLLKAGDYVAGQDLLVSLVVFARVKQGSTYVDSAPQFVAWPHMIGNDDQEFAMMSPNKLYFQSDPRPFDPATVSVGPNGIELPYAWTSLEVPDPRFNYRAANWIQNTKDGAGIPNNGINPSTLALLGKEGRDGDVFMTVSNAGELLSPGELGFILRPFKYNAGSGTGVNFRNRTAVDPAVDDSDAYFRTIRLYDHSKTDPVDDMIRLTADPVFRYITAQNADGTVQGARVNPLSDIPLVLSAAIEQTPADYWFASKDFSANKSLLQANNFNKFLSTSDWRKFTNAWVSCLLNIPNVIQRPTPPNQPQRPAGSEMRTSWQYGLPDYYSRFDVFGWYSEGDSQTIFNPFGVKPKDVPGAPATLGTPLHEIDRKMLYSFSLEAFSDRQQLFLYILRAEVTVPSFGSSQESGTRSLAGGRAVALVWRDPYPEGYDKESDSWLYKNNSHWFSLLKRVSPWYQVNNKKYNTDLEENNVGGDPSITRRLDGYHQHRILYFKQLKN